MSKVVKPSLIQAINTSGKKPEVVEYGYAVYRLPLTYEGVYVERDLLALSWESKKGEKKIRPIRVVSKNYYLLPHSRLEQEAKDAGFEVQVVETGTAFKAIAFRDEETSLVIRNSYRVGSFKIDLSVKVEDTYLPVFTDYIRMPHLQTRGEVLNANALEEALLFATTISSQLPKLQEEITPMGFLEFLRGLKVVRRKYDGMLVKEEIDEIGAQLYAKLKKYSNLYDFSIQLMKEISTLPNTYAYRRIKDRVERYTGAVIREVLKLREALARHQLVSV